MLVPMTALERNEVSNWGGEGGMGRKGMARRKGNSPSPTRQ